jgi:hypothetical protein
MVHVLVVMIIAGDRVLELVLALPLASRASLDDCYECIHIARFQTCDETHGERTSLHPDLVPVVLA